jgi:predicted dienelactone hydrolase
MVLPVRLRNCLVPMCSPPLAILAIATTIGVMLGVRPPPTLAAERLTISYGLLERSVSLESLANYASAGSLDDDLYVYTRYVKPEQRELLRRSLSLKSDLSPVAVSQFLYSPQGRILLERLGQVIQPESRDNGLYAIRAALILAASDPVQGLTPLNVLRHFPTRGIRIDLQKSLTITAELDDLIRQTNQAAQAIARQVEQEAGPTAGTLPPAPANLALPGPVRWVRQEMALDDRRRITFSGFARIRKVKFDLYTPQTRKNRQYPVIVISHGVGSDRGSFAYLAKHLASHGYVVVVPAHPGSDAQQMAALLNGTAQELALPSEFVDRPLDVKFILDQLAADQRFSYANWQEVGVIGQSFGGYTAMALAGATLNFAQLAQACQSNRQLSTLNISLLLQCRAAVLPPQHYDIADTRVKAILTVNAISATVFGQSGVAQIQVPTMVISGKADTVAPAFPEQIRPFTWLTTPDRYLVLIDRSTHFSFIDESTTGEGVQLALPPGVVGPNPAQNRRYLNTLSLAFFRTHLQQQSSFQPYLTAAYGRSISQDPLRLDLVRQFELAKMSP